MNTPSHRNALRRLVRCLFAEGLLDAQALRFVPEGTQVFLPLRDPSTLLRFDDLRVLPASSFINHGALSLLEPGEPPFAIETPEHLIDILRGQLDPSPAADAIAALKTDVANSVANDALARAHRAAWNAELAGQIAAGGARGLIDHLQRSLGGRGVREAAILLDQWGSLEGHPFYPTWKTKPALDPEQVARLSPEFGPVVPLTLGALRADMAHIERMPQVSSVHDYVATRFPAAWAQWKAGLNALGEDERRWLPLPLHPWHAAHFVRQQYAAEIAERLLIVEGPTIDTRPTMSFRTMLPVAPHTPFIKLPIALWLTSEQRSLQAKSIHMGPRISTLIRRILAEEGAKDDLGGRLEIFDEELAYHYRHAERQQDAPGRYLSVVFRDTLRAFERRDGLLPVPVAALFADAPGSGRPLVLELIEAGGQAATPDTAAAYFRTYVRAIVRPVIAIYLLYGIGLEAHQQNAAVLVDGTGAPHGLLMRDFGDGRTYAPLLEARGHTLQPYVHPGILPTVFRDDIVPVRSFVIDACFVCHLHELALLLTDACGIGDHRLWQVLREETLAAFDAVAPRVPDAALWRAERAAFIEQPWPTRSLLRMHLARYADYRLQHALPNPLAQAGG
jgi:siderophore synthetase component